MEKDKNSFLFMDSWITLFQSMPSQEAGDLIKAVCDFSTGKQAEIENPLVLAMFNLIKKQMEENKENYKAKCEKQAEYGKMGSEKRWGKTQKQEKSKENSDSIVKDSYPISEDGYPIQKDSYPINSDRVEWHKEEEKEENILPPYSPPKGGEADSSLRSESRQNIDGYTPPKPERTDYQGVLDAYHECCPSFPAVMKLTETRKRAIKARLNDFGLDEIKRAFSLAGQSDFLKGSSGWQASFDWLMKPANMTKVLEGNYTNRASPAGGKSQSMWGEDDFVAKVIRGETSLAEEGWFNGMGKVVDERGNPA
nr:MAG TPA: hypothetical protein [Caudoviricetes sp.]